MIECQHIVYFLGHCLLFGEEATGLGMAVLPLPACLLPVSVGRDWSHRFPRGVSWPQLKAPSGEGAVISVFEVQGTGERRWSQADPRNNQHTKYVVGCVPVFVVWEILGVSVRLFTPFAGQTHSPPSPPPHRKRFAKKREKRPTPPPVSQG